MTRVTAIVAALLALSVAVKPAAAQSASATKDPAAASVASRAEQSFQEGKALLQQGRYPEACAKLEESQAEDPASGTLLALAYCQERWGRLASAWTNYRAAAELANREGHSDRRVAATDQANTIAPRVSVFTIVVPEELVGLPGFRVTLDGAPVAKGELGTPIPIDGGTYKLEASAPGRAQWSATIIVKTEQDQKTIVVQLLPAPAPDVTAPAVTGAAQAPHAVAPPLVSDSAAGYRPASLALAAGSLVAIGIGTGFVFIANSKDNASNADGHCDSRGCDARGAELRNSALDAARIATWSFVAGGALALGSVVLYLGTTESKHKPRIAAGIDNGNPHVSFAESF